MAKKKSLLERLEANPRDNWKISDIEKLCNQTGLKLGPPSNGSHYTVQSDHLRDILTIPARRPIKPPYIRNLVNYARAHLEAAENEGDDE